MGATHVVTHCQIRSMAFLRSTRKGGSVQGGAWRGGRVVYTGTRSSEDQAPTRPRPRRDKGTWPCAYSIRALRLNHSSALGA